MMDMNKDLKQEVRTLLGEVDKTHRYSMSRIYGLYNEAFGTQEVPQSCASCLKRKVGELRDWLAKEDVSPTDLAPEDTEVTKKPKRKERRK